MSELNLVAAVCAKRSNYDALMRIGVEVTDFGDAARSVVDAAGEQYKRDADLQALDLDVLRSQLQRRFSAGSMVDSIMEFVAGFPSDVSGINCIDEYRLLRLQRVSTTLATLLAMGKHGEETTALLAKYQRLSACEEGEEFKPRLTLDDFEDGRGARFYAFPTSLNAFIGGGVLRGHNITVYGRPESGKSLFALNYAANVCRQHYKVLYVANEEPETDITLRLLARLYGIKIEALRDRETLALVVHKTRAMYDHWFLLHQAGLSVRDVSQHVARIKPDLVVIDQLKNLSCGRDNRALELDALAQQVRNIGIEHHCVTMSVTQAGQSAHNKLVLSMTDIEWSNTGIPGAADLLIGIGVDAEYEASDKRMISIPKNKINGRHGAFPVWVDRTTTAILSKKRI